MARSKLTLPYLVLEPSDIRADPVDGWRRLEPIEDALGIVLRDGDLVNSWDGLSALGFRRIFYFPQDPGIRLGLVPGSTRYSFVVTGATAGGLLQDELFRQDFGAEACELEVTVRPKSWRLSKDIRLASRLLVSSAGTVDNLLAPAFAGARLWEDSVHFWLEGGRGRIPMEVFSFRTVFHGSGFDSALFHVEVAADASLDIEEAVRIYLNADNPSFVAAIEQCEPMASALLWNGVVRRLVTIAVFQDLLSDDDAYPSGSIGLNIRRWLKQGFPTMSLPAIKNLAGSEPSIFEAMLDSWAGYGRDVFLSARQG